jgi:hypothetical protein
MKNTVFLNVSHVDKFVEEQQAKGNTMSWDGWDVVMFREDPMARTHPRGVYNKTWGFENRIKPTAKGFWVFDRSRLL